MRGWENNSIPETATDAETVKNVRSILSNYGGPFGSALEIGAGVGRLVREMKKQFDYVVGVDISQALVDKSKEYLDSCSCRVLKGDGRYLSLTSDQFDFVYSYVTFQHMYELETIRTNISETFRVLKPGGICRIQTVKGVSNTSENDDGIHRSYLFEDEKDFAQLFREVGFVADVVLGPDYFKYIWVTGQKP